MTIPARSLALLVTAGLLAAAQTAPTSVPLANPGFEAPYAAVNLNGGKISGQLANGWSDESTWADATIQYAQETSNPHSGTSCQKMVVTSPGSGFMDIRQYFPLQAGNLYTVSVWMRGSPGATASLIVSLSPWNVLIQTNVALTAAWQQVSAMGYIAASQTGHLNITMSTPGTVWVDDAAVSYTPGAIAPVPNLGPIAPSFFGMHFQQFTRSQLWNGGFEPPFSQVGVNNPISGQVAANWGAWAASGNVAVYAQDPDNPHGGVSSQKVTVSPATSVDARLRQGVGLQPGAAYTLTAWLRGDAGMTVNLLLEHYNPPGRVYASAAVKLTGDWQQVSTTGEVTDDGLVWVIVQITSPGTVWVDDVSLTDELGQPVSGGMPWPSAGFGTLRILDQPWSLLEPAKGQWNWGPLDSYVQAAQDHGVGDILLNLGQTPGWASSSPDLVTSAGAGAPAPPVDIQDWRDYVTAVAQRYQGRIRYYEIWNEPDSTSTWTGTPAQLVTLTQEAYKILKAVDPSNTVVAPVPFTTGYFDQLLAAGVARYVDMLSFHVYTYANPPETAGQILANVRLVMAKYKVDKMPLWDTEGASGDTTTSPELAPRYIARKFLADLAFGAVRFDWYSWDNRATTWYPPTQQTDRRMLTPAGIAYRTLYAWLVGSTLTQAVIDAAGNWQIWLARPDGSKALVVWNPTQTAQWKLPGTFAALSRHDLAGGVAGVSGNTVTVTDSPVMLTTTVDASPAISSVMNAAGAGNGIAPGGLATLFAAGLAAAAEKPGFLPLPGWWGGVAVTLDGMDCPLLDVESDRVTFQVPYEAAIGTDSLTVSSPAGVSAVYPLAVGAAGPGIYTSDGVRAIATHADGTVNSPDNPAAAGSAVQIALTGVGSVSPSVADGQAPPAGSAAVPSLPATAQLGAAAATVQSLALAPGLVGIAQAVIAVPALATGDYPLVVTVGGVDSMPATVSIAGLPVPKIDALQPGSGTVGRTIDTFTVRGANLAGGIVTFSPPDGITVNPLNSSEGAITVQVVIDASAAVGARQVSVTTSLGVSNALKFQLYYPSPQIADTRTNVFPFFCWGGQTVRGLRIYGDDLDAVTGIRFQSSYGLAVSNVNAARTLVTFDLTIAADASGGPNVVQSTMVYLLTRAGSQLFPVSLISIRGPIDSNLTISNFRVGDIRHSGGNFIVPVIVDFTDALALPSDSPKLVRFALRKPNGGAMYLIDPNPLATWRAPVQAPPPGSKTGTLVFEIPLTDSSVPTGQQMPIMVLIEGPGGRLSNEIITDFLIPQ